MAEQDYIIDGVVVLKKDASKKSTVGQDNHAVRLLVRQYNPTTKTLETRQLGSLAKTGTGYTPRTFTTVADPANGKGQFSIAFRFEADLLADAIVQVVKNTQNPDQVPVAYNADTDAQTTTILVESPVFFNVDDTDAPDTGDHPFVKLEVPGPHSVPGIPNIRPPKPITFDQIKTNYTPKLSHYGSPIELAEVLSQQGKHTRAELIDFVAGDIGVTRTIPVDRPVVLDPVDEEGDPTGEIDYPAQANLEG